LRYSVSRETIYHLQSKNMFHVKKFLKKQSLKVFKTRKIVDFISDFACKVYKNERFFSVRFFSIKIFP